MPSSQQHFIPATTPEPLEKQLVHIISEALEAGQRVVWLLSGGSAIAISVVVARQLANTKHLDHLTIMQVDERYGEVGHPDSNWQALLEAGFSCPGARLIPTLVNLPFDETIAAYQEVLTAALDDNQVRIGFFGIGPDGHTAGMLPGSDSTREEKRLAVGYKWSDYTRITMTTPAIARLTLAVAYVSGPAKREALRNFQKNLSISEQPAQALKKAPELYLYGDNFPL